MYRFCMAAPSTISTLQALSDALVPSLEGMDPSLYAETVSELADSFVERRRTRRVDKSLNEARTYYVIHDADLVLLKDLVGVAVALFPKFNPLASLPTLVGLLYRYRHKRARITDAEAAVLLRLRAVGGGCTVAQLSHELSSLKHPMSEAEVGAALQSLRGAVLADGTQTDFVSEMNGVWRAVDV